MLEFHKYFITCCNNILIDGQPAVIWNMNTFNDMYHSFRLCWWYIMEIFTSKLFNMFSDHFGILLFVANIWVWYSNHVMYKLCNACCTIYIYIPFSCPLLYHHLRGVLGALCKSFWGWLKRISFEQMKVIIEKSLYSKLRAYVNRDVHLNQAQTVQAVHVPKEVLSGT